MSWLPADPESFVPTGFDNPGPAYLQRMLDLERLGRRRTALYVAIQELGKPLTAALYRWDAEHFTTPTLIRVPRHRLSAMIVLGREAARCSRWQPEYNNEPIQTWMGVLCEPWDESTVEVSGG